MAHFPMRCVVCLTFLTPADMFGFVHSHLFIWYLFHIHADVSDLQRRESG